MADDDDYNDEAERQRSGKAKKKRAQKDDADHEDDDAKGGEDEKRKRATRSYLQNDDIKIVIDIIATQHNFLTGSDKLQTRDKAAEAVSRKLGRNFTSEFIGKKVKEFLSALREQQDKKSETGGDRKAITVSDNALTLLKSQDAYLEKKAHAKKETERKEKKKEDGRGLREMTKVALNNNQSLSDLNLSTKDGGQGGAGALATAPNSGGKGRGKHDALMQLSKDMIEKDNTALQALKDTIASHERTALQLQELLKTQQAAHAEEMKRAHEQIAALLKQLSETTAALTRSLH